MLIPKESTNGDDQIKYRPILTCFAKLYKHLIRARLLDKIEKNGGMSERQFGFRKGRSTIDAVEEVVKFANLTNSGA